jgi:hypothetical protein
MTDPPPIVNIPSLWRNTKIRDINPEFGALFLNGFIEAEESDTRLNETSA